MIIIVSKYLVPKGYAALTVFPFVFLREEKMKSNTTLLNHEKIHLRQQAELLIIPFFIWYAFEFLIRATALKKWKAAYKSISFEKEAYTNDFNSNYLKTRTLWSFIKYL